MRVSSNQYHLDTIRNIQGAIERYSKLSVQLATNERISTPSDDPLGAISLRSFDAQLSTLEQYQANIDAVNFNLGQQEAQLSGIVEIIYTMQTLATQAANGANGSNELAAYAQELSVLAPAITDLMNAQDGSGRFMFGGSIVGQPPFQLDQSSGTYQYVGDQHMRQVSVSNNTQVTANVTGNSLDPNANFLNALSTYTAYLTNPATTSAGSESDQFLGELSQFMANVTGEITRIGTTLASMEDMATVNSDIAVFTQGLKDEIQTVDYAEGYIRMNEALASYESSLRVYSSVSDLSLFSLL